MTSSTKAHSTRHRTPDLDTLTRDFEIMKHDIAALAVKLKDDAGDGVSGALQSAIDGLSDRATDLYENLAAQGKRSVDAVSHQVEEQPLMSLLVAFGVGFVTSKLLSR